MPMDMNMDLNMNVNMNTNNVLDPPHMLLPKTEFENYRIHKERYRYLIDQLLRPRRESTYF